ncbi:MAG: hypothetical protein BGO41_01260 [Clostridiales bacterium 38-18]|nr:MAG: hypothetical protein BGO41_01260 [Clostridiales bacterium 38-18]
MNFASLISTAAKAYATKKATSKFNGGKKKGKNNIIISIVMGFVLLLAFIPTMLMSILTPFVNSDTETKELLQDYYYASTEIGIDYVHLVAYDMVRYELDLSQAKPYESALDFLIIQVDVFEDQPTGEVDEFGTETYERVKVSTYTRRGSRATEFLSSITGKAYSDIREVVNDLQNLDDYYYEVKEIASSHIDDMIAQFDSDQIEMLDAIIEANMVSEMYAPTEIPNFSLSMIPTNYFRLPNERLTIVSSPFGYRIHPVYHVRKLHTGTDLVAQSYTFGTDVHPIASGYVVRVQRLLTGYGNNVMIRHTDPNGNTWYSVYAHLNDITVNLADYVSYDDVIGHLGNSGTSTGAHLHLEIKFEQYLIDPDIIFRFE